MPYKKELHDLTCPKCGKEYQVYTQSYLRKLKNEKYGMLCSSCRAKVQWEEMDQTKKLEMKEKSKIGREEYQNNLSQEEKDNIKNKRKDGIEKYWSNLSDEERERISNERSIRQKERMDSLTEEDKIKLGNKISQAIQARNNNMSDKEKMERKLRKQEERKIYYGKDGERLMNKFEQAFNESYLVNDFFYKRNGNRYEIYRKSDNSLAIKVSFDKNDAGCFIFDEKNFFRYFDYLIQTIIPWYKELIEFYFTVCRSSPFPFPKYKDEELVKSFIRLSKLKSDDKSSLNTRSGDRLISHFHESIYYAKRGDSDLSPFDAWKDDELLLKVIRNRLVYQNYLSPNKILQGFNIAKIAQRVSVFSPGRARVLVDKYLSDCNTIFDPFSGFSGRMLGVLSLGKEYIGQDISLIHSNESNRIIEFLKEHKFKVNASVNQRDILESFGEYECLFTCSPYSDKEQWKDVPVDNRSCDDWIDECLKRFKCRKYLFVVDNTTKYQNNIVETISNRAHMSDNSEYVILIEND